MADPAEPTVADEPEAEVLVEEPDADLVDVHTARLGEVDALLLGFLDLYRQLAEQKVAGLTLDQATQESTPTGMTLLGLIKHLAWDERVWFGHYFLGGPDEVLDATTSFHIGPDDTVESVLDEYHEACARSRHILESAPSLDTPAVVPHENFGDVDLRWIVVHMIEETARHTGHMDILRERTDGATGW